MPVSVITAIDVRSGFTYKSSIGRNFVFSHFDLYTSGKNVNFVYGHCLSTKEGSCSIAALTAFNGIKKGLMGVGFSTWNDVKFGGCSVKNSLATGVHIGSMGTQVAGTKNQFGANWVYNSFDAGVGHGKVTVASSHISNTLTTEKIGQCRSAANGIAGWISFVGYNALPDIYGPITAYSPTLPFNTPVTLPGSGQEDVFIVVRKRDQYGLVSQNQKSSHFILTPTGILRLPLATPINLQVLLLKMGIITIQANYLSARTDQDPATSWALWVERNEPADTSRPPDFTSPVRGVNLQMNLPQEESGWWFVSLALYRAVDAAWSNVVTSFVYIPFPPPCPIAVPGGWDIECDCSTQEPEPSLLSSNRFANGIIGYTAHDPITFFGGIEDVFDYTEEGSGSMALNGNHGGRINIGGHIPIYLA